MRGRIPRKNKRWEKTIVKNPFYKKKYSTLYHKLKEQREGLPVHGLFPTILAEVKHHQVVIIEGDKLLAVERVHRYHKHSHLKDIR